jgi:maleate isomerase
MYQPTQRVGLVTPPANPAFEPEMRQLLPPEIAVHVARMPVMPGTTLQQRNARYIDTYLPALASFGDLAIDAQAVGLTGPSYDLGPAADIALQARLSAEAGRPVFLPSRALAEALAALGRRRVVIFSPYPGWLTQQAERYWAAAGMEIVEVFKVSEEFRAYELTPAEVIAALGRISAPDDAAVIMSGTGMGTLDALASVQPGMRAVLLPSNLALAFSLLRSLGAGPSAAFAAVAPTLAGCL